MAILREPRIGTLAESKSYFTLHSADSTKAEEMWFTVRFPAVRQTGFNLVEHMTPDQAGGEFKSSLPDQFTQG
jgi:hypothetical protein